MPILFSQRLRMAVSCAAGLLLFLSTTSTRAENFYGFEKVLHGPTGSTNYTGQPVKFSANRKGGLIVVKMPDTAGTCTSSYRFQWEFKDDISRIQAGKEYRLVAKGDVVNGNCKKNTNSMYISSSMSGSLLADKKGIKKRGKYITIKDVPGGPVTAFPTKSKNNRVRNRADAKVTITYSSINSTLDHDYFTLKFRFSSHPYIPGKSKLYTYEVVYLYKKNHVPSPAGAINCPAVFRLGIQLGILSLATHNNEDVAFCLKALGHAIEAAKGSGCLPAAKLIDLQKRMKSAKSSRAFYAEVVRLRTEYLTLVDAKCSCGGASGKVSSKKTPVTGK